MPSIDTTTLFRSKVRALLILEPQAPIERISEVFHIFEKHKSFSAPAVPAPTNWLEIAAEEKLKLQSDWAYGQFAKNGIQALIANQQRVRDGAPSLRVPIRRRTIKIGRASCRERV